MNAKKTANDNGKGLDELAEKITKMMSENGGDLKEMLGKMGFGEEDEAEAERLEIEEEENAQPETDLERRLVDAFEQDHPASHILLDDYLAATTDENLNDALLRRYFRKGNNTLKALLLFGMESQPLNRKLLWDLGFFHQCHPMLDTLMKHYDYACLHSEGEDFEDLVDDYEYILSEEDVDLYARLKTLISPQASQYELLENLIKQRDIVDNATR